MSVCLGLPITFLNIEEFQTCLGVVCGSAVMSRFQSLMYLIIQISSLYRDIVRSSLRIIYLLVSGLGEDATGYATYRRLSVLYWQLQTSGIVFQLGLMWLLVGGGLLESTTLGHQSPLGEMRRYGYCFHYPYHVLHHGLRRA